MDRALLKHINQQKHADLEKKAIKIIWDFSEKSIHEFRVSYKKLRAFFRMISSREKKSEIIKTNKKIREAYRMAGKIRDLQLYQKKMNTVLENYKFNLQYTPSIKREIKKTKIRLFDRLNKDSFTASLKKTSKKFPLHFTIKELKGFAENKWSYISTALQHTDSDKAIHSLRKHLKDLYYVFEIYSDANIGNATKIILKGNKLKFIKECTDALGRLQDRVSAVTLLNNFSNRKGKWNKSVIKETWLMDIKNSKRLIVKKLSTQLSSSNK